jgi:hypothetical protein
VYCETLKSETMFLRKNVPDNKKVYPEVTGLAARSENCK